MEGKTKTSIPQSGARTVADGDSTGMPLHPKGGRGEDFLEGVPESTAKAKSQSGIPLSVYASPPATQSLSDPPLISPCDMACGACAACRAFDAFKQDKLAA